MKNFSVTLSNFELKIDGKEPEEFGVYLVVDKKGQLSGGCWMVGTRNYSQGIFHQSRGGVIELDDVIDKRYTNG